jgi:hypothetical protein
MNSFVTLAIQLLEVLFVIGCFGSLIVIVLSGVEDFETILSSGDEEPATPSQAKP